MAQLDNMFKNVRYQYVLVLIGVFMMPIPW